MTQPSESRDRTRPHERLIFFVHVPKTAGTSFRVAAEQRLDGRVLRDYGPEADATSTAIRAHVYDKPDRTALRCAIDDANIAMICGHMPYEKYADLVPPERVVVFLRDPVQRVVSEYHHVLRHRDFAGTLLEFAALHAQQNKQWRMLRKLDLGHAGLVGLSERYGESLRLLAQRIGLDLPYRQTNINPEQGDTLVPYPLAAHQAAQLRAHNARDLQLYRQAVQLFAQRTGTTPPPCDDHAEVSPPDPDRDPSLVQGVLGGFEDGKLRGWAAHPGSSSPVRLDVWVDDRLRHTIIADRYRKDLEQKGLHPTGCAGFLVHLGPLPPGTVIRCRVHGSEQELANSPMRVGTP